MKAIRFSPLVLAAVGLALVGVLVMLAEAKGSFGSTRSFGGGYARSGKSGFYSQNYRYSTRGMYWNSYYRYNSGSRTSYVGPSVRLGTGTYSADQEKDVLCTRKVSLFPDTVATPYVTFNSTQNCFKQLYSAPGDPGNVALTDLMLDRYVWNVSVASYPTFDLVVYPDYDIVNATMNASVRLHKLIFADAFTNFSGATSVDLSTIAWTACSLQECPGTGGKTFGRPSSRFVDNDRVTTVAVKGTWAGTVSITIRAWIARDFDQDPYFDHIFLMPGHMKIDVTLDGVTSGTAAESGKYIGLEAIVATVASGPGSSPSIVQVEDSQVPIAFDPLKMNRVQFGSFSDIATRNAANVAWFSGTQSTSLCYNNATNGPCARFMNWGGLPTRCTGGGSDPAECAGLLRPGQVGRAMQWIFQQPYNQNYTGRFYAHFGFVDPDAQFVAPASAPGALSCSVALVVAAMVVLSHLIM